MVLDPTKGPYVLELHPGHGAGLRYVICAPDYGHRIAVVSLNGAPQGDESIALANATLLAASWDMFKALDDIAHGLMFPDNDVEKAIRDRARTARDKAMFKEI